MLEENTDTCYTDDTRSTRMKVDFIAQPQVQLGTLLTNALDSAPPPSNVVLVSAFASLQAVLRLKARLCALSISGGTVRLVVGVDMGGTSKEVLKELATWPVEVFVFKNRKGGVTFHPKLYIVESTTAAEIFLGSNNLTDGGLYGNYEGAVRVAYVLPADAVELANAKTQLDKFINPVGPIGKRLDAEFLELLLLRRDIPDEAETRKRRKEARGSSEPTSPAVDAFGFESTQGPPKLPIEVQQVVLAAVRNQLDALAETKRQVQARARAVRRLTSTAAAAAESDEPMPEPTVDARTFVPLAQITPTSFYLELTATSGGIRAAAAGQPTKIPGEQRVPLEAINAAQDFWGWPDNYVEDRNPRKGDVPGGEDRVYYNWKPKWRLREVGVPANDVLKDIRMYYYQNSSDYRFYSSDLSRWANAGDMIQLTRCEGLPYEYECVLAVAGRPEHAAWKALCTLGSGHSPRVFAFA
jgi:HKD family nuclease